MGSLLADERLVCQELDPRDFSAEGLLFSEEHSAIERAVPKRRREYAAGRVLARRALSEFGTEPAPLLADVERVPSWPAGFIGCITHTDSWCAVAVARRRDFAALGIDVERRRALEPALVGRICRESERSWLSAVRPAEPGVLATGIFSAKESLYKALFPSVRRFLDFQGVTLELSASSAIDTFEWQARLERDWGSLRRGTRIGPGRLRIFPTLVASCLALPAAGLGHQNSAS